MGFPQTTAAYVPPQQLAAVLAVIGHAMATGDTIGEVEVLDDRGGTNTIRVRVQALRVPELRKLLASFPGIDITREDR